MPYAEGRLFYDADSHVMETPEWLPAYADPAFRDRIRPFSLGSTGTTDRVRQMIERGKRRAGEPAERAGHEAELLTRKSWDAYGAFHREDRTRALDLLGFNAQLVFSTFAPGQSEFAKDIDVSYAAARALTRAMLDFCAPRQATPAGHLHPAARARARRRRSALRARRRNQRADDFSDSRRQRIRSRTRSFTRCMRWLRSAAYRSSSTSRTMRRARSPRVSATTAGRDRPISTAAARTSPASSTWPSATGSRWRWPR